MLHSQARDRCAGALCSFTHLVLVGSLLAGGAGVARAQTAPAGSVNESANERAKREGDKVFEWIRIHSDKPRKAAAPSEKTPVTAAAPASRPASKVAAKATVKPAQAVAAEHPARSAANAADPQAQAAATAAASQPGAAGAAPVAARLDAAAAALPTAQSDEDVPLTPVFKPAPEFPGALMRTMRKGQVQVAFTVQPDGSVSEARALSSTHPRLAPSAVSTVSQWKFQPVRHAQQAVVDLGFNLD